MTYEYTNSTLIEAELRASSLFSATTVPSLVQLTTWITEESAKINHDAGYNIGSTQYVEYYDYDINESSIYLKAVPVITVDTLQYNPYELGNSSYSAGWETKTADTDYTVYEEKGKIDMLSGFSPSDGRKKFKITYTAGYSEIPKTIQMLATKMTALRVLNSLIQSNVNDRNDGGSISVGSINIVEPSNYGVGSYTKLKNDIDDLRKDLITGFGVNRYGSY